MKRRRYSDREYIDLVWDGPQVEYYVAGHVGVDEFRSEMERWFGERNGQVSPRMPMGSHVDHGFSRVVRAPNDEFGCRANVFQFQRDPWPGFGHQMRVTRWVSEARGVGARKDGGE